MTKSRIAATKPEKLRFGIWGSVDGLTGIIHMTLDRHSAIQEYEVGYWMGERFCGKGIMSAACKTLVEHAPNYVQVDLFTAHVRPGNRISAKVLTNAGFVLSGKRTGWDDYMREL